MLHSHLNATFKHAEVSQARSELILLQADRKSDLLSKDVCLSFDSLSIGEPQPHSSSHLPHTSNHQPPSQLLSQISFDPMVRIIRNFKQEDSSDDDLPVWNKPDSRRSRNLPSKGPVRLSTKKFTLPLNISTTSLIGSHQNHSTISLPPPLPSASQSVRQLIEQTRQEIEEDEQFIPDTPRHLNLILPLITRQPSRRILRQQEERRLQRWKERFGGGKSNLKSSHYTHLCYLSTDLRKILNKASLPVQLSTNTTINSIPSSISPTDLLVAQSQVEPTHTANLTKTQKGPLSSKSVDRYALDSQPARISNLVIDELSCSDSELNPSSPVKFHKIFRFGWIGAKLKASRFSKNVPHPLPDRPSANSPCHETFIQNAPLTRTSTPLAPSYETLTSGTPLEKSPTPATASRKQSSVGLPLRRSATPGAFSERQPTSGASLKAVSSKFSSPMHHSNAAAFFRGLVHWPKPSFFSNRDPLNSISSPNDRQLNVSTDEVSGNPPLPSLPNFSKSSLLLDNRQAHTVDKWRNRTKVSLRQCCETCLQNAELGKDPNHEITFSNRARQQYYSKSWFLEDVVKQGGIPAQHIKLISKELGPPYDAWVAQAGN